METGLGFQVMKYEARNVGGVATSTHEGLPWRNISQLQSILECNRIGAHLITNAEWTALARHIAAQDSNWSTGNVGSGVLSRGYSASTVYASISDGFANTTLAPNTGVGYEYNINSNTVGASSDPELFKLKRTHNLANGQIVWDLSGNLAEWTNDTCIEGTGSGKWYFDGGLEWSSTPLNDYERFIAGPNPLYTANAGRYWGCSIDGNVFARGALWSSGVGAGIFALDLRYSSSHTFNHIGFRCAR